MDNSLNKAVVLVSHGSHSPKTKEEVAALVEALKKKSGIKIFEYAFLEIESPNIPQGIERCVAQGARDIVVLLNFLNSGRHVDTDIPRIVEESRKQFPQAVIRISQPVGQHQKIADLFLDLIK